MNAEKSEGIYILHSCSLFLLLPMPAPIRRWEIDYLQKVGEVLGVTTDDRLNFNTNVESPTSLQRQNQNLSSLSNRNPLRTKLTLYYAPSYLYACAKRKLEAFQNVRPTYRILTNSPWFVCNNAIETGPYPLVEEFVFSLTLIRFFRCLWTSDIYLINCRYTARDEGPPCQIIDRDLVLCWITLHKPLHKQLPLRNIFSKCIMSLPSLESAIGLHQSPHS